MKKVKVLMLASVASMIDQFNMPNICLLLEMGCNVHVACNFEQGNTCDSEQIQRLQKTLQDMHVIWHQWDCPRNLGSITKCWKAYKQLLELTDRYSYEWLHCHSPIGGALARLAAHRRKMKVIYTAHGFHFYQGAPWKNWLLYYPAEKLLAYWTDVLITVNKEDYSFAKQNLQAKEIYYIPGIGIDAERFRPHEAGSEAGRYLEQTDKAAECEIREDEKIFFRKKYHIPEDAVILLSVGELSRRKNHQEVISALSKLSGWNVYYLICGQGMCGKALMRQAKKLGVAGRIRMLGFQRDIAQYYEQADIFVFPSLQEGMPAALMEAMASGLPCIVSDIRGNRELIDDTDPTPGGIRYSLKQPAQLLRALEQMLDNEQLRYMCGVHNRRKIRRYDKQAVQKRMKKIYAEALALEKINAKSVRSCTFGREENQPFAKLPKISVIMSVYNTQDRRVLGAAIHSIRNQTCKDWELIICDDGSTDHTWETLRNLVGNDPRILCIRNKKNHKAGYARNVCINAARGQYIAIMDADDIAGRDRLQKELAYLENHPKAAFVGCRGEFFVRNVGDDGELYWFCRHPKPKDFLFSLPFVHASLMFRQEVLRRIGGYDCSKRAVRAEDYDLLLRLYSEGCYGTNLSDVLYYIRRDEKQYRRRKYRYRFHEAYIKYRSFKKLGLMPKGMAYAAKPLIAGLVPVRLRTILQKKYYMRNAEKYDRKNEKAV